jgi:hypothetical protein
MAHIFISYSSKDLKYANHLNKLLTERGFEVWMDKFRVLPGMSWWDEIEKAIIKCSAFIIIMSENSRKSDWVKRELLIARDDKNRKPIIPVLLEGKEWSDVAELHYEDMRSKLRYLPTSHFINALEGYTSVKAGTALGKDVTPLKWIYRSIRTLPYMAAMLIAALATYVVVAQSPQEFFMAPNDNTLVKRADPIFRWADFEQSATHYRVVVLDDIGDVCSVEISRFDVEFCDKNACTVIVCEKNLLAGDYTWVLQAVADGEAIGTPAIATFVIEPSKN